LILLQENTNEQITLKPLEEKIINDFKTSKFIVCSDTGLASKTNRKFNNTHKRSFITTQSIKKLKRFLKKWALDLSSDWKLLGNNKTYDISKLREEEAFIQTFRNKTFYKERWIKEDGLEQRLIITYSVKYQEYQKKIRNKQIERALKLLNSDLKKLEKAKQNDPKRFIKEVNTTSDGEIAPKKYYHLDQNAILEESQYDGLYAVCTNLEDEIEEIVNINHQTWEMEECFRIMKNDFKSRPIYLSKDERIKAHFLTCFLALIIYRYFEKKLDNKYTIEELLKTLKGMNVFKEKNNYIPTYTRTDITDYIHKKFDFRTDYEVITEKNLKKIISFTKTKNLRSF
jgi:transposase